MKKTLGVILMLLGGLFLLQLLVLTWFYFNGPLGLFNKEAVSKAAIEKTEATQTGTSDESVQESGDVSPSALQAEKAASLGVDIPTFTAEQITCFTNIFGKTRVEEIKAGAVPTALELYQGKECL